MPFYKVDSGQLLVADDFVYAPTFTLTSALHETYEYPMDGWSWFDTLEQAYSGLPYFPPVLSVYEILLGGDTSEQSKANVKVDLVSVLGLTLEQVNQVLIIMSK